MLNPKYTGKRLSKYMRKETEDWASKKNDEWLAGCPASSAVIECRFLTHELVWSKLRNNLCPEKNKKLAEVNRCFFRDDRKEQRDSSMCNFCGEFFSRANILLHKLTHTSENERKKVSGSVSKDVSKAAEKPSYTCKICGKIYTVRKTFVTHKNNHRRNKKIKEMGIHPFDKKACLNLKAMSNAAISESKPVNDNFKVKTKSVKSMMNPDVIVNPMGKNDSNRNSKVKPELPQKNMINPDVIANPISVNGCSSKMKSEMPMKFTAYPVVREKPMCVKDNNDDFKLKSELLGKLMINLDPTANPISVNGDSSKIKSAIPTTFTVYPDVIEKPISVNYSTNDLTLKPKSIKNFDPTANPMSCTADWAPPKPVESHNDVPPTVSPIQLVSGDSSLTKTSPAKKTLYRCYKCDKTYTKKKALVNHRVNHMQNVKKHKFLYYDKTNKKTKKSLKEIMQKGKKKN
ncbi:zinc finger protein 23 [Parasteatoda tepidariorum]|uniref:zinc finger protein 23 n=1 Tax=Parasteatoda tepidariorum TaxID=114398 RepID=UPI001C7270D7|nr:uncharacterized protein LOC122269594 [Parasteatoda tepidariorum]